MITVNKLSDKITIFTAIKLIPLKDMAFYFSFQHLNPLSMFDSSPLPTIEAERDARHLICQPPLQLECGLS